MAVSVLVERPEDPADAMNAGAVLRSCDAFGVTETWFIHNGIREGTSMREHIELMTDLIALAEKYDFKSGSNYVYKWTWAAFSIRSHVLC